MDTIKFKLVNGELKLANEESARQWKKLLSSMNDNDTLEVFANIYHKGTYAQLKMVHTLIRAISNDFGIPFDDVKLNAKKRAGLVTDEGIKSFKYCSAEELTSVVNELINLQVELQNQSNQ